MKGPQTLSANGKLLFFSACNRRDGYGSCDIYFSRFKNGKWQKTCKCKSSGKYTGLGVTTVDISQWQLPLFCQQPQRGQRENGHMEMSALWIQFKRAPGMGVCLKILETVLTQLAMNCRHLYILTVKLCFFHPTIG